LILTRLGLSLEKRFEVTGALADLDQAVDAGRAATAATSTPDGDQIAISLSNLGNALRRRYGQTGARVDLDEAIALARRALTALPAGYHSRHLYLSNLVSALMTEPNTLDAAELDEAIDTARAAAESPTADGVGRPTYLNALAQALGERYTRSGNERDLTEAIAVARRAAAASSDQDPRQPQLLHNLAVYLRRAYEHFGSRPDLDDSIAFLTRAVEVSDRASPFRSMCLIALGRSLINRFGDSEDRSDADAALVHFREAAGLAQTSAETRLDAATMWAVVAGGLESGSTDAIDAYSAAVELMPVLAWRGLNRTDQERLLARRGSVPGDAAATAIAGGQPATAVRLLEASRGVLWSQMLDQRTDLSTLSDMAPDLADRLTAMRSILDSPVPESQLALPGLLELGVIEPGGRGPGTTVASVPRK
jgi:tetratricopeptide (TPR) repeat protein